MQRQTLTPGELNPANQRLANASELDVRPGKSTLVLRQGKNGSMATVNQPLESKKSGFLHLFQQNKKVVLQKKFS